MTPDLDQLEALLAVKYKINCGGTHWEGCWQEHVTCYAAALRNALARVTAERDAAEALIRQREHEVMTGRNEQHERLVNERDALRAACDLALERIDYIGCHNCGTGGRPSPCDQCAKAIAAIDAARGKDGR